MTYVEFFDRTDAENIGSCLTRIPDRVVFVGDNAKKMKKHIERYKKLFSDRGYNIDFLYKTVRKGNLDNTVEILSEIVERYGNCVFDISGGEGILNVALGIVYTKYPEKVSIHSVNIRNNAVFDCDKDGVTVFEHTPELSVEENVRIYGGDVIFGDINENKTYKWDLNEDFINDVNIIWGIARQSIRYFNAQVGILSGIEKVGQASSDGVTRARIQDVERELSKYKARYKPSKKIVEFLTKKGLIVFFDDSDGENVEVLYKNEQVKKCLTTGGKALELKVFLAAKSVLEDGSNVYNDVINGAFIDWDGEEHEASAEKQYDTENEIDVLMMHGIVPVFVSCKTGIVTNEELYKLNTVAQRFGGQYSKKVLIATALDDMKENGRYLRQRMEDMNIRLIDDIHILDDSEIERKIKSLWK